MKYIETGKKRSDAKRKWLIMVDDEDYDFLNQFSWQADKYGCVSTHGNKNQKRTLIHRLIIKVPPNLEIDHKDGNRLNNQKSNLRLASSSQNKCNRGPRIDTKSGYKGVSWHKQRKKWTVRIQNGKTYKHLGLFIDIKDAIKAYNNASQKYHGEFAFINLIS